MPKRKVNHLKPSFDIKIQFTSCPSTKRIDYNTQSGSNSQRSIQINEVIVNPTQPSNPNTDNEEDKLKELRIEVQKLLEGLEAEGLKDLTTTSTVKHQIRIQPGIRPIKQRIRAK